jgi:hypothetical protein
LNTDLELSADFNLRRLIDAMKESGVYLLNEETLSSGCAVFESCLHSITAAETISSLVGVIEALPADARTAFDRCTSRIFDIGYRSGFEPASISSNLPVPLLQRIADLKASVSITIYGAAQAE